MPESCREISYDDWIRHVFDFPPEDPAWFHREDSQGGGWYPKDFSEPLLAYMTRFFKDAGSVLSCYRRRQIDDGLSYLVGASDFLQEIKNDALALEDRLTCVNSMFLLYRDLMAPMYGDSLQSCPNSMLTIGFTLDMNNLYTKALRQRRSGRDLWFACYMWWDVIPVYGGMDCAGHRELGAAVLRLFDRVLREIQVESCVESVLHGCGHWYRYYPDDVERIISSYISRRPKISAWLRCYAEAARRGNVL
ncbi:MAG: hypothetical protein ACPGXK_11560 [Phycisphaerae bacterium]